MSNYNNQINILQHQSKMRKIFTGQFITGNRCAISETVELQINQFDGGILLRFYVTFHP